MRGTAQGEEGPAELAQPSGAERHPQRSARPNGKQGNVVIHTILFRGTVEEQMWELINAKAAAQRTSHQA